MAKRLVTNFAYLFEGINKNGTVRKASEVLGLQTMMQTLPSGAVDHCALLRVVGCEVLRTGGWGKFRLYGTVNNFIDEILSTPTCERHFATVTLDHARLPKANGRDRLYAFLDCEARGAPWTDAPRSKTALLDALGIFYCKTFAVAFPQHTPWDWAEIWVFSKEAPMEVSFHLHSTQCVWDSAEDQKAFMQQLKIDIEDAYLDTTHQDNKAARTICIKGEDDKLHHFVDWSVYTKTQFLKLPLCMKPGKACMTMFRAPASEPPNPPERRQLEAGMIVATTYDPKTLLKLASPGPGKGGGKGGGKGMRAKKRKRAEYTNKIETAAYIGQTDIDTITRYTKHAIDPTRCIYKHGYPPSIFVKAPHSSHCHISDRIHSSGGNVNHSNVTWSPVAGKLWVTTGCFSPKCGTNTKSTWVIDDPETRTNLTKLFWAIRYKAKSKSKSKSK
jgi:hypothetical protein